MAGCADDWMAHRVDRKRVPISDLGCEGSAECETVRWSALGAIPIGFQIALAGSLINAASLVGKESRAMGFCRYRFLSLSVAWVYSYSAPSNTVGSVWGKGLRLLSSTHAKEVVVRILRTRCHVVL